MQEFAAIWFRICIIPTKMGILYEKAKSYRNLYEYLAFLWYTYYGKEFALFCKNSICRNNCINILWSQYVNI